MADPFSDMRLNSNPEHSYIPSNFLPSHLVQNQDNKKLPRIEKQKQYRNSRMVAKNFIKSSTKLPNLKIESSLADDGEKKISDPISNTNILIERIKTRQKSEGDDFTTEIEKKLRIVLEGQNNTENYAEASDSEEEFQKKINRHKEVIKRERLRRLAESETTLEQNGNRNGPAVINSVLDRRRESGNVTQEQIQKGFIAQKYKGDPIYEKRMKDYKEQSLGNRFLAKKKEIALKQHIFKKSQQKDQQPLTNNFQSMKHKSPQNKSITKKISNKLLHATTIKDEDLFDNLHNILLNPARKSENNIAKQRPKRTKENLEEHLKMIEQKLSEQRKEDLELLAKLEISKKQKAKLEVESTNTAFSNMVKEDYQSWRKIDVSNMGLEAKKSNFEEQVQRINRYFERSERSIEKYIENQRKIANLNLLKKKAYEEPAQIKV